MLRSALAAASSARRSVLARSASSAPPSPPPTTTTSFIARAKAFGAQALLGRLTATPRFDRVLSSLRVTRVDEAAGEVDCEFEVEEGLQNTYSTLHGGATATLVDVVGSMALLSRDPTRAGVSVDLSVSYLAAARAGDTVRCLGRALKVGRRLGFSSVELRRKADGELLAVGRHTKAYTEERVSIPTTLDPGRH
jgi:acyl-coenzyme A thioesterase 13